MLRARPIQSPVSDHSRQWRFKQKNQRIRCAAYLGKLGELFVCQHGDVTEQLVAAVPAGGGQASVKGAIQGVDRTKPAGLTARESAWAPTRGGYTACTETRGKPNWRGSPWRTAGRQPDAAGIPFFLGRDHIFISKATKALHCAAVFGIGSRRTRFLCPPIS